MAYTLIGVYDHYPKAESAFNDLLATGFPRGALQISPVEETYDGRQAALRALDQAGDQSTDSLSLPEFLGALFGGEQRNESADIYLEAVRRGAYLLIVNAESDEQRDRALEIMQRHFPLDVEERAAQWRSHGWSKYDTSAPVLTDPDLGHEPPLYTEERPTQPVAEVQGDPKSASAYFTGRLPRSSVRIFQRGFRGL